MRSVTRASSLRALHLILRIASSKVTLEIPPLKNPPNPP